MAKRMVVFPVKDRQWAFSVASNPTNSAGTSPMQASFKEAWLLAREYRLSGKTVFQSVTPLTHYVSNKMESQWITLGAAKEGSIKHRLYRVGEKLLSRIKPSEMFLKSIPADATSLEIIFPSGLNPRLVRRRVRHIGKSGAQIHSKYMYGSFACLPFSVLFGILPVPNVPLFWNMFRAYSNWQALEGSRKLLKFVNDGSCSAQSNAETLKKNNTSVQVFQNALVLSPCKRLKNMLRNDKDQPASLSDSSIARICDLYHLDYIKTLAWRELKDKKKEKMAT